VVEVVEVVVVAVVVADYEINHYHDAQRFVGFVVPLQ
jgi:hypothetical protein